MTSHRHLMSRFRQAAGPVNWQRGVVLPETADRMTGYNVQQERGMYGPPSVSPPWHPEDVSTAFVQLGERMHALQVNHEKTIVDQPYLWSIHRHYAQPDGGDPRTSWGWEHLDPGNRDHECSMCQAGPGEKCHPDCWDQNSHTGGPLGTTDEDRQWHDGTGGELWGWQPDRESAQRAAETAWTRYAGQQNAERDRNLDAADPNDLGSAPPPDDDFFDIFGDR